MNLIFLAAVFLTICLNPSQNSVRACSPVAAGIHVGQIRTLIENREQLIGFIDQNPCLFVSCSRSLNDPGVATIDLATGRLRPGVPSNATLVPLPVGSPSSTAGYTIKEVGTNISFTSPNGKSVASIQPPFEDYTFYGTYFVSQKLQKGYVLFEQNNCRSTHGVAAAIIDLNTSDVLVSFTEISEYSLPFGFDCQLTGYGSNDPEAQQIVYDEVQVTAIGIGSAGSSFCLGHTYVFYNETNIHFTSQTGVFESWDLLDSIIYRREDADPNENSAFLVHHDYGDESCSEPGAFGLCPENYTIHETRISTGDILRSIYLNRQDIVSIASGNYTAPKPTANDTVAPDNNSTFQPGNPTPIPSADDSVFPDNTLTKYPTPVPSACPDSIRFSRVFALIVSVILWCYLAS